MTTVFPHVHTDDLDVVLDNQGNAVFPYSSVSLKSINNKRVLAREDAMTQESINGVQYVGDTENGQESQAAS